MLPIYGPYRVGNIPSSSGILRYPFLLIRTIREIQILVLEFSKDGSANLGDKFADGGAANQPVILQGGVGLSCVQVSQHYCQFQCNSKWLPDIGDRLLDAVVYAFFNEIKKAGGILT